MLASGRHAGELTGEIDICFHVPFRRRACINWSTTEINFDAPMKACCCWRRLTVSSSMLTPLNWSRCDWSVLWTAWAAWALVCAAAAATVTAVDHRLILVVQAPSRSAPATRLRSSSAAMAKAVWLSSAFPFLAAASIRGCDISVLLTAMLVASVPV